MEDNVERVVPERKRGHVNLREGRQCATRQAGSEVAQTMSLIDLEKLELAHRRLLDEVVEESVVTEKSHHREGECHRSQVASASRARQPLLPIDVVCFVFGETPLVDQLPPQNTSPLEPFGAATEASFWRASRRSRIPRSRFREHALGETVHAGTALRERCTPRLRRRSKITSLSFASKHGNRLRSHALKPA